MANGESVLMGVLLMFLGVSLIYDVRMRRIPNFVVLPGAVVAVIANLALAGVAGAGMAVSGWLCGMAVLFPMYLLNAMGAGDVKLMGMVGAFIGPLDVLGATLASLVIGGLLALLMAVRGNRVREVCSNIGGIVRSGYLRLAGYGALAVEKEIKPVGHLPYAVAIFAGTVVYLLGKAVL